MFGWFRNSVQKAREEEGLYFAALLDKKVIDSAFGDARSEWQGWIYTPAVTVWVFLSQCLSPDHSCRDAVARLMAWMVAQGRKPCSPETNAYCSARDAIPETVASELVRQTGRELETNAPAEWRWHGRNVRVVDGTTVTMPDTPENQAEYPQLSSQMPGCGFPIARILVVFSLAVGTVLEAVIGKYQGKRTGENSLFRTVFQQLERDDVVVGDRFFCGWFDIALLQDQWVDVVFRKHQTRRTDFRSGQRLGRDDHLVCWKKPCRPEWMSREQYDALPDELVLREMRVRVTQRGFRTKVLLVITTLIDPDEFSMNDISDLYRRRWQAELHLRNLKITMQMDHLRCKTPHRVRNEISMHFLAYNLVRRVMCVAAFQKKTPPWQVSFKGTLQALNQFLPLLTTCISIDDACDALLRCASAQPVGKRPDRVEPRLVKKRPKKYKSLREPRANYRRRSQQGA